MEEKIKEIFKIDSSVIQDRKIKSLFYNHESFNAEKKRIFDLNIESIKLIALFNDETINITPYKDEEYVYEEIYLITAKLKNDKNTDKIVDLIHFLIPNPVILVLYYNNQIYISGSISRINKHNDEKAILEEIHKSIWLPIDSDSQIYKEAIQSFDIKKYSYHSLKDFYEDFIKAVILTNFIEMIGEFKYSSKYSIINISSLIKSFDDKSLVIITYKNEQKQTSSFGDKVVLQNNILKVEKEVEIIKNQAKELIQNL